MAQYAEDMYAMHFAFTREPSRAEIDRLSAAVAHLGGAAHCDGDQAQEWGEPVETDQTIDELHVDHWERLARKCWHVTVYVDKGHRPGQVWEECLRDAMANLPLLPAIDELWGGGSAYWENGDVHPFTVDEAAVWGEHVGSAWMTSVRCSNRPPYANYRPVRSA